MTAERCKIREASLITGLDIRTLQEKAAKGEIPGADLRELDHGIPHPRKQGE